MKRQTIEAVETACFEQYIETGNPQTIADLADAANVSEQSVRNAVRATSKLRYMPIPKTIMSKDYPWMVHQTRNVDAYVPRRDWLRKSILQQRRVTEHKVQYGH